jgi:integrase
MTSAIIKQGTRILVPKEYAKFREQLNPVYQNIADVLLYTGMRVEEFWAFCDHPTWYKASRHCISLPKGSIKKVKCLNKERDITLNEMGCKVIETMQALEYKKVTRHAMNQAFKLAASKSIGVEGIAPKMFRKTCISWLVKIYPSLHLNIAASSGHSLEVMRQHYLSTSFAKEDVDDMKVWFQGWGE